ncbi:MAG: fibronectin type III domain-containing protein [Thermodesulfobacteriota bacterium]
MKRMLAVCAVLMGIGWIGCIESHADILWCNPANTGEQTGKTKATGFRTLWDAMRAMTPGDTVKIANGDWSRNVPGMTIESVDHLPAPGIHYDMMSAIEAETDWKVILPKIQDLGTGRNYVRLRGLVVNQEFTTLYGWTNSKIYRCGFLGAKKDGNVATFALFKGNYNVVEECIAWGGGRYKFIDYQGHHNIFRRCVARHDWYISPGWAGQESNFRGYGCNHSAWQNCISIDSDREMYQTPASTEDADFWIGDQSGAGGNVVTGCIVLHGMYQAYYLAGPNEKPLSATLTHSIAVGPSLVGQEHLSGAVTFGTVDAHIENCLFWDYRRGIQHAINHNKEMGGLTLKSSVFRTVGRLNAKGLKAENNLYFDTESSAYGSGSIELDPVQNGFSYPCMPDPGSKAAAMGCGPILLKRIGKPLAAMDEPGWDLTTDENLWPFPNEADIGRLMKQTVEGVSGAYGFTAEGQTLSHYIWGAFGKTVPPFLIKGVAGNGKALLQWARVAPASENGLTGYRIYDVSGPSPVLLKTLAGKSFDGVLLTDLQNGKRYRFTVTAVNAQTGESGWVYSLPLQPEATLPDISVK